MANELPEGFIPHDGGPCPVPLDSMVEIVWGDGLTFSGRSAVGFTIWPENWNWHLSGVPMSERIIAYKPEDQTNG